MNSYRFIISIFLTIALLFSAAAVSASAKSTYIRGDADSDGIVRILDVTVIQRVIAGLENDSKGAVKRSCDIDGNGLDITDAVKIQRYLAEYNDPYHIGKQFSYDEYELPFVPD